MSDGANWKQRAIDAEALLAKAGAKIEQTIMALPLKEAITAIVHLGGIVQDISATADAGKPQHDAKMRELALDRDARNAVIDAVAYWREHAEHDYCDWLAKADVCPSLKAEQRMVRAFDALQGVDDAVLSRAMELQP